MRLANNRSSRWSPRPRAGSCTSSTSRPSATTCWPRSPAGPRRITAPCSAARRPTATATSPAFTTAWSSSRGLDQRLGYDRWPRKSLVDHFFAVDVDPADVAAGRAEEQGDFVHGVYDAKLRRSDGRVQVQLTREGSVQGRKVKLTKGVTLNAGEATLEIAYSARKPAGRHRPALGAGVQLRRPARRAPTTAISPAASGQRLGQLGHQLDLQGMTQLGLVDEWLGIGVTLAFDQPASVWTYPVETVSQTEGGFELVHQSVAVLPHWIVIPDAEGRWSVTMRLSIDTQLAESRMPQIAEPATA